MKHTPTPWTAETHTVQDGKGGYKYVRVYPSDNYSHEVALVTTKIDSQEDKANAEFIVRACNSHDKLIEALKEASDLLWEAPVQYRSDIVHRIKVLEQTLDEVEGG